MLSKAASWRKFFITSAGYMGLASMAIRSGDVVCSLFGGEVPYLLRPAGDDTYTSVGECHVHRMMDGEGLKPVQSGKTSLEPGKHIAQGQSEEHDGNLQTELFVIV